MDPRRRATSRSLPTCPTRIARSKPSSTKSTMRSDTTTSNFTIRITLDESRQSRVPRVSPPCCTSTSGAKCRAVRPPTGRRSPRPPPDRSTTRPSVHRTPVRFRSATAGAWCDLTGALQDACSRSPIWRDSDEVDVPKRSAAATKLPLSTTRTNDCIADQRSMRDSPVFRDEHLRRATFVSQCGPSTLHLSRNQRRNDD